MAVLSDGSRQRLSLNDGLVEISVEEEPQKGHPRSLESEDAEGVLDVSDPGVEEQVLHGDLDQGHLVKLEERLAVLLDGDGGQLGPPGESGKNLFAAFPGEIEWDALEAGVLEAGEAVAGAGAG